MVNIRRPTRPRNRRGMIVGGSTTTSRTSIIGTCRMIIFCLVTLLILRMMKNVIFNNTVPQPNNNIPPPPQQQQLQNNYNRNPSTRGFKGMLNDSKQQVGRPIKDIDIGPDHNDILSNPKKVLMPSDNYHSHEQHVLHEQQQEQQIKEQDQHDFHHSNPDEKDANLLGPEGHIEEPELSPDDHDNAGADKTTNNNNSHPVDFQQYDGNNESFKLTLLKKGSGPTNVAYVKDFEYEYDHPKFRTDVSNLKLDDHDPQDARFAISIQHSMEETVASLVKESSVKACRNLNLVDDNSSKAITSKARTMNPKCVDNDALLIVYNQAEFPRTWCGKTIEPKSAMKLVDVDHHCTLESDPIATIFHPSIPPIDAKGMGRMIIKSHSEPMLPNLHDGDLEVVDSCSIPCHKEKGMNGNSIYFESGKGIPNSWKMYSTMTDSQTDGHAKLGHTQYRNDQYFSTQNLKSSVPRTNFDSKKYSIDKVQQPVDFNEVYAKAVYMINPPCAKGQSQSKKYFQAISQKPANLNVDAIGGCYHNAEVPAGETIETMEGRINIMKKYRMVLAFDDATDPDHTTGIVWEALLSGALPVVISAKNIEKHVPPHSIISSNTFKDHNLMALYVKEVMNDKEKWDSYHAWRNDISSNWQPILDKYGFAKTSVDCRMCKWGYAKTYGLGWNHSTQEITESKLSKRLCIQSNTEIDTKLVVRPFQEEWLIKSRKNKNDENFVIMETAKHEQQCSNDDDTDIGSTQYETTIVHDSYQVHRTVVQHDGITDIIITSVEGAEETTDDIVLRLYFPSVRNLEGGYFPNTHTLVPLLVRKPLVSSATIQDKNTRVTILADWITDITVGSKQAMGVIELTIAKAAQEQQQRIRIITEDTNTVQEKMTEFFPSSFGKVMTKDFVDPLELFYIDS